MKNHKIRKMIVAVVIMVMCITTNAAAFSDVPGNASYADALNRLTSLGIISGSEAKFNPNDLLSREQFAKMIVVAAGLEDDAAALAGSTVFPDIAPGAWSSGYINVAISKKFITGMTNGKFQPASNITYAQVCTAFVTALGYTSQDVPGLWPANYIQKAGALGLTTGIKLASSAGVPRWTAAIMFDRLLDTYIKKSSPTAADQTFIAATGSFIQCIVFGDSRTLDTLTAGQVLTDKGVYSNPSNIALELGSVNYLVVKSGSILKASGQSSSILKVSVDQATDTRVSYKNNGTDESMILPDNVTYYYKGQKQDFKNVPALLQKDSSIVFNYNNSKTAYEYAVVFDPVYSKPVIAENFVPSSGRLGSISFGDNPIIIRNGESIDITQIENKDVVYQVSDIWSGNKYVDVVDNKVGGKITAVLPNSLSPRTLQIDSTNYDFSNDIDLDKISNTSSTFAIGNNIVVYLGYNGKIANIEQFGTENNSDYAVVLNNSSITSTNLDGTRNYVYTAKLLFSDGITATYNVSSNPLSMKGQLVKYKFLDDQTVALEQLPYNFPSDTTVNKNDRMLGSSYVADNVKIFNIVHNDTNAEIQANILKWEDIPYGAIENDKVWYINKAGPFDDINVILTYDVLNQGIRPGIVKAAGISSSGKGGSYNYTILIDGKVCQYTKYIPDISIGSVYRFKLTNSGVDSITQSMLPDVTSKNVQAIDSRRIKINGKVYFFNNGVSVYYKDTAGNVTTKTLADIDTAQTYQQIALYMDSSSDTAKVDVIVLTE